MNRTLAVLMVMSVLAGGCSNEDSSSKQAIPEAPASSENEPRPATSAVVAPGRDTIVETEGVRVTVPAGATTDGSTLSIAVVENQPETPEILGPVVEIALDGELSSPATISMPFDRSLLDGATDPWLYTWVDDSEQWLPQDAEIQGGLIVAQTMHFSGWGWGSPFYGWGKITGDRTSPPSCEDGLPSWAVGDFIRVDDPNTSVFACAENAGDLVRVKLKANRGDPVLIEFSHKPTVDGGSTQSTLMTQLLQERWPNRAYIEARQELIVTFPQPERAGVISGKRWGGDGARYLIAGFTMFLENVLAGAPGKLPQLYRSAKCLFDSGQFAGGSDDQFEGVGSSLSMLTSCLEEQLESLRADGIINGIEFSRLSQAFALWRFADTFTKAMDVVLIDSSDRYDYFGIQTRRIDPQAGRAEAVCQAVETRLAWEQSDPNWEALMGALGSDPFTYPHFGGWIVDGPGEYEDLVIYVLSISGESILIYQVGPDGWVSPGESLAGAPLGEEMIGDVPDTSDALTIESGQGGISVSDGDNVLCSYRFDGM